MMISRLFGSERGTLNFLGRILTIIFRFGLTPRKMEAMLNRYVDLTEKFDCEPTFPVTAVTLRRHPELIRKLDRRGVELAIHGYIHIDYRSIPIEEQLRHLKRAVTIFEDCRIPFIGFRAPYLSGSTVTLEALSKMDFAYDSSRVVNWNVLEEDKFSAGAWREYLGLLEFYLTRDSDSCLVLPKIENGLLEIPVSMPDDEAMVGRLDIKDEAEIARIWRMIFKRTYERGELFTLQLHHERIPYCEVALNSVLREARSASPPVWIATLGNISEWWKEKEKFSFDVVNLSSDRWQVRAACTDRATILSRNCEIDKLAIDWADGYQSVDEREFVIKCPVRPFIGLSPDTANSAIEFFKSEGYVVELNERSESYGIYFGDLTSFKDVDEKRVSETIAHSNSPLIRFWRWPDKAKSALAITGDIDAITLVDFVMRVFEVWRQRISLKNWRC